MKKLHLPVSYDGLLGPTVGRLLGHFLQNDGTYPAWVRRLPTMLTLSRLAIVPLAGILFWSIHVESTLWPPILMIAIALLFATDAFDGTVARMAGATSDRGAMLDPLIDKIASLAILICWLTLSHEFIWGSFIVLAFFATLRIALDITLASIAKMEKQLDLHPKAQPWGKRKVHADLLAFTLGLVSVYLAAIGAGGALVLSWSAVGILSLAMVLAMLSIQEHMDNLFSYYRD